MVASPKPKKTMKNRKQPAYRITEAIGGVRATARLLNVSPAAVSRWRTATNNGGSGGTIPTRHWLKIIKRAKRAGVILQIHDFLRGSGGQ
jgi:DNA-binding transcriptional regulator YdaS (Cro superfamily)